MSQHTSLKVDSVGIKHRNVLSRLERIKKMRSQEKWAEGDSVFKLPKLKSLKIKVKKSGGGKKEDKEGGDAKGKEAAKK